VRTLPNAQLEQATAGLLLLFYFSHINNELMMDLDENELHKIETVGIHYIVD